MKIRQWKVLLTIFLMVVPHIKGAEDLDSTFGKGVGYVTTENGQGIQFNAVQIQSNGKIVAAGFTQNPNTQSIVARYNTDGSLDTSFGTNGMVITNVGSVTASTIINDLAIQATGEIVVAGESNDGGTATGFIARYTASGALDGTFGTGGIVITTMGDSLVWNGVVLQDDGNIVVTGTIVLSGTANGIVGRFDSTGSADDTFGTDGFVTELVEFNTNFHGVVLDSSANIVVTGFGSASGGQQAITARHTSLGVLDSDFGTSGIVTTQVGDNTTIDGLAIDNSGNIVISGLTTISGLNHFLVIRYTTEGDLDTSFNGTGSVTALIGGASSSSNVVIQDDGKIVVAGYAVDVIDSASVIRYTSSGSLDTTFGDGGIVFLELGMGSRFTGLDMQTSDGRVVAVGFEIDSVSGQQVGLVARLNKNNSDFVSITSIAQGSTITTKIPIISGTSSEASADVVITINGDVFTTVTTDGSGNWNAGISSVLPVGINSIRADLIADSEVLVSDEVSVTVVDEFGEDAVFAYDTTTHSSLTGTFADIPFSNNGQIGTWSHTLGTASFTCNQAGTYQISYAGTAREVSESGSFSASLRLVKNGTPIAGSQVTNSLGISATLGLVTITAGSILPVDGSVLVVLAAGDVIKMQAAGSNARLETAGEGTESPSASLIITRIA